MQLSYAQPILLAFPELVFGAVEIDGISNQVDMSGDIAALLDRARTRLAAHNESELPEIRAWRQAFTQMGLKPTQYRCAAEALLRRLRKEGNLPSFHPVIDLCNAASCAYAIPVAVFDRARTGDLLKVRYAQGGEPLATFSGEVERAEVNEVIFADLKGNAHARRWSHRQSSQSAVRAETTDILIVAEAHHTTAVEDVQRLIAELTCIFRSRFCPSRIAGISSKETGQPHMTAPL
ncbi:B3/B4 domain-containing protein [Roseibium sediminicola]|uniref:Phenylalanine--tRNA ligase beta subunit-related protein n=1 Tax=Roseibium sediminicola TaxID=2933272 RepID=A0ABT0H0I6_9HYPH|nr:phenylalanine--tRNA ligase beta subunit-related protein [Roseibium sp. CAU 1639]MCK7614970.1 phenylalanine--tRNA ligase beta subunit-related protein [Roseibium sp. CAU 1639]